MIVDSIDSMMIMGLDEEYERARNWIATKLSFEREGKHSTFEVSALTRKDQGKTNQIHPMS